MVGLLGCKYPSIYTYIYIYICILTIMRFFAYTTYIMTRLLLCSNNTKVTHPCGIAIIKYPQLAPETPTTYTGSNTLRLLFY